MAERKKHNDKQARCRGNCLTLRWALMVILFVLCAYVYVIQVLNQDNLVEKSERQQSRLTYVPARRGAILDRHGEILNSCIPQYDLAIRLDKLRDPRDTRNATLNKTQAAIAELAVFLGSDFYFHRPDRQAIEKHIQLNAPLPFVIWTNLDAKTIVRFEKHHEQFPYAEITLTWCRDYSHGNTSALIRGFVKRIPARQKDLPDSLRFLANVGELEGASGLEQSFDKQLSGESGYQKIQTDVMSFRHDTVESKNSVSGKDVKTTIDILWQKTAEDLLEASGKAGALVMMDARNGEILVMASSPTHHLPPRSEDSNLIGGYVNRAIAGYYPPGSTIKPFFALAALEQGIISPDETIYCPGFFELPDGRRVKCSSINGHGTLNVTQAIAMSCNTFFCEVSKRLGTTGYDLLNASQNTNGFFGKKTGIEGLKGEIPGVFFSPSWVKNNRFDDIVWHDGDAANAGIGQGAWIVTPLQQVVYACAITTGRLFQPKLVCNDHPALKHTLNWETSVWQPVLQGLFDCVQSPYGTGRRLAINQMNIYAKTGTAEHGSDPMPHAWMFAVYPAENPQFAVACVLEQGGHGGETVAPILRHFILSTFSD